MIWMGTLAITAILIYIGHAVLTGWLDVKNAPREPMEWCHKHGHFRKGHCLPIAGTLVCPICYRDAIKGAEKLNGKTTVRSAK